MRVIAVNGSARKGWNTHTLLQKALDGAASKGATTEMVNLYDLDYKGCLGCLGCKRKGGEIGRCAVKDALRPIFDSIEECDAFILGSPIYIGEVTGEMRSFYERLTFQYVSYDKERIMQFGKRIKTAFIFTTNCPENFYEEVGYTVKFKEYGDMLTRMFGESRILAASETWQIDDYDNYNMTMFDVPDRRRRREEVFPEDCKKAFALGEWAAGGNA
ncbi:MAG: flavodoxin family protein [Oscillospiraceae bacterium]|nr:flavodoxin family protein [Oscillospiraceae bacterium]